MTIFQDQTRADLIHLSQYADLLTCSSFDFKQEHQETVQSALTEIRSLLCRAGNLDELLRARDSRYARRYSLLPTEKRKLLLDILGKLEKCQLGEVVRWSDIERVITEASR